MLGRGRCAGEAIRIEYGNVDSACVDLAGSVEGPLAGAGSIYLSRLVPGGGFNFGVTLGNLPRIGVVIRLSCF